MRRRAAPVRSIVTRTARTFRADRADSTCVMQRVEHVLGVKIDFGHGRRSCSAVSA